MNLYFIEVTKWLEGGAYRMNTYITIVVVTNIPWHLLDEELNRELKLKPPFNGVGDIRYTLHYHADEDDLEDGLSSYSKSMLVRSHFISISSDKKNPMFKDKATLEEWRKRVMEPRTIGGPTYSTMSDDDDDEEWEDDD